MSASDTYYTYEDLCKRWGVCRRTIQRWVRFGIPGSVPREPFPHVRMGRRVRFSYDQIRYVESRLERAFILPAKPGRKSATPRKTTSTKGGRAA